MSIKEELTELFKLVDENPKEVILDIVNNLKSQNKLTSISDADLCNWGLSFRMNNWVWQRTHEEQAGMCMIEEWR